MQHVNALDGLGPHPHGCGCAAVDRQRAGMCAAESFDIDKGTGQTLFGPGASKGILLDSFKNSSHGFWTLKHIYRP